MATVTMTRVMRIVMVATDTMFDDLAETVVFVVTFMSRDGCSAAVIVVVAASVDRVVATTTPSERT
jgi:hypothetical protein